MADTVISPNMNLPVPVVGTDSGPDWANNLNACLGLIDSHTHNVGYGVPVTPNGLSISTDLPFGSNNATALRSTRFTPQGSVLSSASSDLGCLYVSGVDLYFNDVSGNQVRVTQNGGVAGSPGSISNLVSPASASYSSGAATFIWQSAANTSAIMDAGSVIIRNATASSNGVTVAAPAALGSNYSLVLPLLPASTKIVTLDASGNFGASTDVDGSTLQLNSNTLSVKALGVTGSQVAATTLTRAKFAAVGQQVSASSGAFTTGATSPTDVTNLSVTITTFGRPVMLIIQSDGVTTNSIVGVRDSSGTGAASASGFVYFLRDAGVIATNKMLMQTQTNITRELGVPPSSFMYLDVAAAGTYTYKVQVQLVAGTTIDVTSCVLVAYEL